MTEDRFHDSLAPLFERSADGWILVDRMGDVILANAAARAVLSVDDERVEGTPISTWILDLPLDRSASVLERTMISAKGDRFPAEVSVIPLTETDGRRWIIFRDITLRKGFEGSVRHHADELERMVTARMNELEDVRERYRRLYDTVPVLDFELDSQNDIASANRKACMSLGVPLDRLVGLPLADLAIAEKKKDLAEAIGRMRQGSVTPYETRLRASDGSVLDIVFHAVRDCDTGRSAMRVVGLDVTARREAEQLVDQSLELAEAQRARMERILRGIGEGVVVTDPDGQVRLMNPIAERFLDIDEQFAFGRNLFAEQRDSDFARTWRTFVDGREDLGGGELKIGAGPNRVFVVTLSRIRTAEGKPAGCVAVLRDVTKERRVDQMKRDFVSNITHELRTPLASIRGFTTTMLRGGPVSEEDRARFLRIVEKESERLQHLIEGLLTLSSLDNGREALDLQAGDFSTILSDASEMFTPLAQEKGVELQVVHGGRNGAGIFDPQKMRRVLDNLIGNALKFTPAGGEVNVDFARNGDTIVCTVSDTGPGIAPGQLERIFDRFYTRASAAGGNPSGSGLGLHIVRRLVELHDGTVAVESKVGEGTTFRFHFPAVPRVREATPKTGAGPVSDTITEPFADLPGDEPAWQPDLSAPPEEPIVDSTLDDDDEVPVGNLPELPPGDPLLDDDEEEDGAPGSPEFRIVRPPAPPASRQVDPTRRA
ncbi:MAG: ATP-binding protein [bacterium]